MPTLAALRFDVVPWIELAYLVAAVLFIVGLKMLAKVPTARRGNQVSAIGMLVATVATFLLLFPLGNAWISLIWVLSAILLGSAIGLVMARRVQMTAMPEMVALLNGFGGIASLLVALAAYFEAYDRIARESWDNPLATGLATLIGGVTFTGSLVAYGKLAKRFVPDQPVQAPGQRILVGGLLIASIVLSVLLIAFPTQWWILLVIAGLSLALGVLLVIGIGGADMPVVVALLNSYSGLAAAMAGFVLGNAVLIITGSLVGASGLILTSIMCKAMNRSLMNVLFGGMGALPTGDSGGGTAIDGEARESTFEDASIVLDAARKVMIVPGYGMAVAQAQHAVKELQEELESRGVDVAYAIHPVAGRMPGHMNVLLAEAGVPYESLLDLEGANPQLEQSDVALVIGANDVTNPAARHDQSSPLYGMPILDVDKARTVFVIKRSLSPGFAGIQNELYFKDNTRMLFGDAKKVVAELVKELGA